MSGTENEAADFSAKDHSVTANKEENDKPAENKNNSDADNAADDDNDIDELSEDDKAPDSDELSNDLDKPVANAKQLAEDEGKG